MIDGLPLPTLLDTPAGDVALRLAASADLTALAILLADDDISRSRGDDGDSTEAYAQALAEIAVTAGNAQLVAERDGRLVGTLQLTVIPGLARAGARRMQVETVRVSATERSGGIGAAMMRWVEDVAAPTTGCTLIQLTSDRARTAAHRFYDRLGYTASHVGFKRRVPAAD